MLKHLWKAVSAGLLATAGVLGTLALTGGKVDATAIGAAVATGIAAAVAAYKVPYAPKPSA